MKKGILFFAGLCFAFNAFSQIEVDKSIHLSGTGTNAKISGIDTTIAAKDAVSAKALQRGSLVYADATGTGNPYNVNLTPAITAYTAGMMISFKANVQSPAGGTSISVNGLAAKSIKKNVSTDLALGDIAAGQLVSVMYDGTNFQLLAGAVPSGSNNYVQNNTVDATFGTGQVSSFDITGNGEIGGTLNVNGNVGIGTVSVGTGAKAEIRNGNLKLNGATAPFSPGIFNSNSIYLADNQYLDFSDGNFKAASAGTSNRLQLSYNSGFNFYNSPSAGSNATVTSNKVFTIGLDGKTGVGSGTPRGIFDVNADGDIYLVSSPNTGTSQSNFLTGHIYLAPYAGTNIAYLQARRADNSGTMAMRLRTYNAGALVEAIHIDGDGEVGIGNTNPDARLDVTGTVLNLNAGCVVQGTNWATGASGSGYGAGTFFTANSYTASGSFGDTRLVNQQSAFNTSNGIFTAPYNGFYMVTVRISGVSEGQRTLVAASRNGAYPTEIFDVHNAHASCPSCQDYSWSGLVYLNKNDTHRIVRHSAGTAISTIVIGYKLL